MSGFVPHLTPGLLKPYSHTGSYFMRVKVTQRQPKLTLSLILPTFGPLRVLLVILSLYVLCVGSIPCTDGMHTHEETALITKEGNEHHQENHEDICPPFCNCNCCGCSPCANHMYQISNLSMISGSELIYLNCNSQFLSRNFSSVWQPPKIG